MSRYNLSEFIESKRAGRQTEIELPDGSTIRVDPIDLWSDDALTLSQTDPVKAAKTILGEDVYTQFKAGGGSAGVLFALLTDKQGVTAGEASPSPS
jgi:hypothetical protein